MTWTARRPISLGSQGKPVKKLQRKLKVRVDGDFGPATAKAVRKYKRKNGLKDDSVVRKRMWKKLGFRYRPAPGVGKMQGSPGVIINRVIYDAQRHGFDDTPNGNDAANGRHGPTVNGGKSDHQGPKSVAWAVDLSNGSSPTKEMDAYARRLAKRFNLDWNGSGIVSGWKNGYRIQMLYRTNIGGNHYNHIHIGVRRG